MSRATGEITGVGAPSAGRSERLAAARDRVARLESPALPWLALGALLVVGAAVLWHLTRDTTLWFDEWQWALYRRGNDLGTFLRPHNDHLSLVPIVLYRLLFATAGLDHYGAYRAMVIAAHLGVVTLVFAYARTRVGAVLALLAAALVLFLGPAWQNILWPFQVGWLISIAAGLGALLMLDRRDRRGDVGAAALLLVSLASSGIGVAFALGMAVDVICGRRRVRDAWIVAAPLVPYAVWWVAYQQSVWASAARLRGIDHPLLHGILHAPAFVVRSASSATSSVAGLGRPTTEDLTGAGTFLTWGRPLLAAALIAAAVRLWRSRSLPPRVLALAVVVGSFWTFTAITRGFISSPYTSRYLYVGGVLVVLLAVELARGATVSNRALALVAAATLGAVVANVGMLQDGARYLRLQAQLTRAEVSALDIGRPVARAGFLANSLWNLRAGPYYAAEAAHGSPATDGPALAGLPESARLYVDGELKGLHRIAPHPVTGSPRLGEQPQLQGARGGSTTERGACLAFRPAPFAGTGAGAAQMVVTLPAAGLLIRASGGPLALGARRFADEYQTLPGLAAGARATLRIAPDRDPRPWHVAIRPAAGAVVCGLAWRP